MPQITPPLRRAAPPDAPVLAELVNAAGEGLPHHLWQGMAGPGEDPWEIGAARQRAKLEASEIYVVDEGAGAVAGLTGYLLPTEPEPIPEDFPAIFRPLQELENLAPGTWYVNVLACLPGHRGRGLGGRLLDLAHEIAVESGATGLSLIVAGNNPGAVRLYTRRGYGEIARRPVIREGWRTEATDWLLMTRPL